jgi:GNAT superfamily N-acetyltransferase
MSEYVIRKAKVEDVDELVRQRRALLDETDDVDEGALTVMAEAAKPYFERAIPDGTFHAWLAETPEGVAIGGGAVVVTAHPPSAHEPYPQRAHILNIYVDPSHRRQGVARSVMDAILEWCRAEGFHRVTLNASKQGRPLYEGLGFKQTNNLRLRLR